MTAFILTINKQLISVRGVAIALFAGLFVLSACGGGAPLVAVNSTTNTTTGDGPCDKNPFANDCLKDGESARADALTACRNTVQASPAADCASNIPAAAVACFRDPYSSACDTTEYAAVLTRSPATQKLDALRTRRTDDCRMDTLTGTALCASAIVNTCKPAADASSGVVRALLVTDNLCNDVADYNDERADFLMDCTDAEESTPLAECEVNGMDVVNTYCQANLFTETAGCLTNSDFNDGRIAFCVASTDEVPNANLDQCKNLATLTACFTNPFGNGCAVLLGTGSMTARDNRATYCRDLTAEALATDDLCTGAVVNFCNSAEAANPFDMICRDDDYDIARIEHCQLAMVDDMDSFNPPAGCEVEGKNIVDVYCEANLFTPRAKCSTNSDFDDERITFCIEGANADNNECKQNQLAFSPEQRKCFGDPFGDGCDMEGKLGLGSDLTRRPDKPYNLLSHGGRLAFWRQILFAKGRLQVFAGLTNLMGFAWRMFINRGVKPPVAPHHLMAIARLP